MKRVDRANYVRFARYAYQDAPQYVMSSSGLAYFATPMRWGL